MNIIEQSDAQQMESILAWARNITANPEKCPPLEINGQKLRLIAAYGTPDGNTENHPAPAELNPFFIHESRSKDEETSAVPDRASYVQLYFDVPLPEHAKAAKASEKASLGNTEPVVADVAIAISSKGIEVSCWNGLHEQTTRAQDREVCNLAEIGAVNAKDFEIINQAIAVKLQDISHEPSSLPYLTQELLKNSPTFQKAFPFLVEKTHRVENPQHIVNNVESVESPKSAPQIGG
jgi:hypothetical protein